MNVEILFNQCSERPAATTMMKITLTRDILPVILLPLVYLTVTNKEQGELSTILGRCILFFFF